MNVNQGDMAIIVGAKEAPQNNGRIVEVIRPFLKGEVWGHTMKVKGNPSWIVRTHGAPLAITTENTLTGNKWVRYVPERPYSDCCLRPIRDPGDDAVDEMVLLVGKPEGVTA